MALEGERFLQSSFHSRATIAFELLPDCMFQGDGAINHSFFFFFNLVWLYRFYLGKTPRCLAMNENTTALKKDTASS
jgi:hypothetical protein